MYGLPEDDAVLVTRGSPSGSAWKKSWKIEKAELAEMMTRRSLSWKLSKALERSGASDPRVTVALLNIWPKSAVDQKKGHAARTPRVLASLDTKPNARFPPLPKDKFERWPELAATVRKTGSPKY